MDMTLSQPSGPQFPLCTLYFREWCQESSSLSSLDTQIIHSSLSSTPHSTNHKVLLVPFLSISGTHLLLFTATALLLGQSPVMHPSLPVSTLVSLFPGPLLATHPPQSSHSGVSSIHTESCPALLKIWSKILEFTNPSRPHPLSLISSSFTFLKILHPTCKLESQSAILEGQSRVFMIPL